MPLLKEGLWKNRVFPVVDLVLAGFCEFSFLLIRELLPAPLNVSLYLHIFVISKINLEKKTKTSFDLNKRSVFFEFLFRLPDCKFQI